MKKRILTAVIILLIYASIAVGVFQLASCNDDGTHPNPDDPIGVPDDTTLIISDTTQRIQSINEVHK